MWRRVGMTLAAISLLAAAGCSAGATSTSARGGAPFVVLGSEVTTTAVTHTDMPGLAANSVPQAGIKGVPGAAEVTVAGGTPAISRDKAIEITRPNDGTLVSAVLVALPKKFMAAVINNPKNAKPTTAWIVTWTRVTQHSTGGAYVVGRPSTSSVRHGDTTAVIDASSGEQLFLAQYSTPGAAGTSGSDAAGVTP